MQEEVYFDKLMTIYRSPELLLKMTGKPKEPKKWLLYKFIDINVVFFNPTF